MVILSISLIPIGVRAQTSLEDPPAPVRIQETELRGEKPYSGFVENGKNLSDEEYAQYRKDRDRKESIIFYSIVGGVIGAIVGIVIWYKRHKRI